MSEKTVTITRRNKTLTVQPVPKGIGKILGYTHVNYQRQPGGGLLAEREWRRVYTESDGALKTLPGYFSRVRDWLVAEGYEVVVSDLRTRLVPAAFEPRAEDRELVSQLAAAGVVGENGILIGPCGLGKTTVIQRIIESLGPKAKILITTDSNTVLRQGYRKLKAALSNEFDVGIWCTVEKTPPKNIMLVSSDSLGRLKDERFVTAGLGLEDFEAFIVDEVHSLPTPTVLPWLNQIKAGFRIGLTASFSRADGAHFLLEGYFGPVLKEITYSEGVAAKAVAPMKVIFLPVPYIKPTNPALDFQVGAPEWRVNAFGLIRYAPYLYILKSVIKQLQGKPHLIFAKWTRFCAVLHKHLGKTYPIIHAGLHPSIQESLKEQFASGKLTQAIATDTLHKGFDVPHLEYVIMAAPAGANVIQQRAGRAGRISNGKEKGIVIDFLHLQHPILFRQSITALKRYKQEGFEVEVLLEQSLLGKNHQLSPKDLEILKECLSSFSSIGERR